MEKSKRGFRKAIVKFLKSFFLTNFSFNTSTIRESLSPATHRNPKKARIINGWSGINCQMCPFEEVKKGKKKDIKKINRIINLFWKVKTPTNIEITPGQNHFPTPLCKYSFIRAKLSKYEVADSTPGSPILK